MLPLVSGILPTRGRTAMALRAVDCFLAQTYPNRELIVLDDIHGRSFPNGIESLPIGKGLIIYLMHASRSIAEKRNLCVSYARGEVIAHVDSDDHSEPTRLEDQVRLLTESGKAVTGFHSLLFYEEQSGRAYKYIGACGFNALGTSLVYTKEFWEGHRFGPDPASQPNVGEDSRFVKEARDAGQLITVDGGQLQVARAHSGNTSIKEMNRPGQLEYRPVPLSALPEGFHR